jgi:O-acetylhomoserine (thiol)-lyase
MTTTLHPSTLAIHAGFRSDPATGCVTVPIYATSAYQFDDTEQAADLFALKKFGNIYSRLTNPTNDALEKRLAAIEGGVAALTVASGQAATAIALRNLAAQGDNIVSSTGLYGGTFNLFKNVFRDGGIEVRFVDPSDPENFRRATDDRTRAYFAETLPNPKLDVFPIAEVAAIGRPLGIPLIVDNTSAPLLCRPFDHGAAVIVTSITKWINGHANAMGGAIIDGGNFTWEAFPERQPKLNSPDPSYHGTVWTELARDLGPIAYILKARTTLLRDEGPCLSPFNAYLALVGLETLGVRMKAHGANALRVVEFLQKHPAVRRVIHPSLFGGKAGKRARTYLTGGLGSLVGFELRGGVEAGRTFINALRLVYHVANIGDTRTLATHPASTTHSQLTPDEQLLTGVTPGFVRLSVGLEEVEDVIADLDQALAAATLAQVA